MDISEVLADKGLDKETLNCPCTPEHRNEIAIQITSWETLAPFIGLSSTDEEEIEEDNKSTKSKRIALLRKWNEKLGKGATYLHLMKGFAKIERRDLIEKLCDMFVSGGGVRGGRGDASGGASVGGTSRGRGAAAQKDAVPHLGKSMSYYSVD